MLTLPTSIRDATRRDLRSLVPAATLLTLWLVWIGSSGGFEARLWYPSGLFAASLLMIVIFGGGRLMPGHPLARAALLLFAAIVALSYLSILWSTSTGSALDASNQLALYLIVGWAFSLLRWTPRALAWLMVAWSVGVCAFCADAVLRAVAAPVLTPFFINGRFSTPMQYSNATGAVAVMAMWPALILSSRREVPAIGRAACLGIAAFLADFATLPQSRAALVGLFLTAPVALAVSAGRWRLMLRLGTVAGALAICLPRTVNVDRAVNAGRDVTPVLRHAASGMLWTAVAAIVTGAVVALCEDRFGGRAAGSAWPGAAFRRRLSRALLILAAVTAAIAVGVAEPRIAHLTATAVKSGSTDAGTGSARLLSASPEERLDYWRVALDDFSARPLLGIGAGNFGPTYDAARVFVKHSAFTHNLPLRVLGETGIVGELLFVAFLATALAGLLRGMREGDDLIRAASAIALCVSGYFLIHSCLDWVDEFPALAAPALALPLAAISLPAPPRQRRQRASARVRGIRPSAPVAGRVAATIVALGGVGIVVALTSGYLSLVYVHRAFVVFRATPGQAYHDLSLARSIDPLSANPSTSEGTISLYRGDVARSQTAFRRSLQQEDAWYPRVELALIAASRSQFASALPEVDAAVALDVHDPVVQQVRRLIVDHRRLDPFAVNQQLLQEASATSAVQSTIR